MNINCDVVIVGGGVAGLWLANLCQKLGINFIVLEKGRLGEGQSIASQGIIHGGLKYALGGSLSGASEAIRAMPAAWQACLTNSGQIPLAPVRVLSQAQYLWSSGLIGSISNFFASHSLQSRITKLTKTDYPSILQNKNFTGLVYKLDELVIDIQSLLNTLSTAIHPNLIKINDVKVNVTDNKVKNLNVTINEQNTCVTAKYYIFTAGSSNEVLCRDLYNPPKMQQRPLQQLFLKSKILPEFFAHNISAAFNPIVTITSHKNKENIPVWYVGGKIAEEGSSQTKAEFIQVGKILLHKLLPWLNLEDVAWGSCYVMRAEAEQANQSKPDSITYFERQNAIIAWPTKLAFSPLLAEKICALIKFDGFNKGVTSLDTLANYPKPLIADYPWNIEQNYAT